MRRAALLFVLSPILALRPAIVGAQERATVAGSIRSTGAPTGESASGAARELRSPGTALMLVLVVVNIVQRLVWARRAL